MKQDVRAKRAEAQSIPVTLQVGKSGVTDATIAELVAQLKQRRLVKVRLLPSQGGDAAAVAEDLAGKTDSIVVDVRGHTVVLWRQ